MTVILSRANRALRMNWYARHVRCLSIEFEVPVVELMLYVSSSVQAVYLMFQSIVCIE